MDPDDKEKYLKRYPNSSDQKDDPSGRNRPDWNTRQGMMSEEEVKELSAERGKPEIGAVRADQSGRPGPQPEGDPSRRADAESGPSGKLKRKKAENDKNKPPTPPSDWTKYDWA
ncbi:MAG TPA: hypothetical protein V6D22_14940 [Candidatus Obscuribacterales bacterium]